MTSPDDLDRLRAGWRTYWRNWRAYHTERDRAREASWQAWLGNRAGPWREPRFAPFPALPAELRGLICGARTRRGTLCKRRDLYQSGRCKLHGGLSTGPTSIEGKARAARNGEPASRTPCNRQGYGKAGRTPCEPLDCTNAGSRANPM